MVAFWAMAAIAFAAGSCVPGSDNSGGGNRPVAFIVPDASYLPADGASCTTIHLAGVGPSAPPLTVNLGQVLGLTPSPGGWDAQLCAGDQPGRVVFSLGPGIAPAAPEFYFYPPPAEPEPEDGETAAAAFTLDLDPQNNTAILIATDIADGWSVGVDVEVAGYQFIGSIAFVAVTVSGSSTPDDLRSVRVRLDNISDPTVSVFADGNGPAPDGAPWFDYGDFMNTPRAITELGSPSSWTKIWIFSITSTAPFTVTGSVLASLFAPDDGNADFRIDPYVTAAADGQATVAWETDHEARSFIVYGPTPECDLVAAGSGERNQINIDYTYINPTRFDSFFHRATLTGLEPDAPVYYRVITVRDPGPARAFSAGTAPGQPFTFGVISDTQQGDNAVHSGLVALMRNEPLSFYLHSGDLVHNSAAEAQWLNFFTIESPLARTSPIFPAVGNHDTFSFDLFYKRYFKNGLSPEVPADLAGHAYSFNWGNCHFAAIDSNLPVAPASEQYQWLDSDLAAAQADPDRKFTFVFEHHPTITSFTYGYWPDGANYLAPLFQARDVDAVFAGHVHVYERSDVSGRIFITNGGGGGDLFYEAPNLAQDPYYVLSEYTHEFLTVSVGPDSFQIRVYDTSGTIIDQVSYAKP